MGVRLNPSTRGALSFLSIKTDQLVEELVSVLE
ncbi:hypothetical protein DES32_2190 [Methylovirgula ligni]|uniref:Uncharacterized protein n=1 Tax=Methylovirgula ligni TaxID=569860 RepID=A0A3D9YUG5_9HYPH|nr:hypothetical protein DES32_2190 [Methylovirgula ligni]